ncbi:anaerobic ribonucleoside-triphosphate reductase, partial [Enterobacter hormaechei]|uniref:anaerobic ribonucleoside-triphosphate reductase n=1 Tax=Enterobacter hormaechei TaxID=158836 RepID=UPI003CC5439D
MRVISLNLPRIALEAKGNEAAFWTLLDERLQLARKALMTRIARLEGVKAASRQFSIWKGPA